jgi:uncharacterized lipoprotein YbaY
MVDRHWLRDVSLAILLALPVAAVAQPHVSVHQPSASSTAKLSVASSVPASGRISLLG